MKINSAVHQPPTTKDLSLTMPSQILFVCFVCRMFCLVGLARLVWGAVSCGRCILLWRWCFLDHLHLLEMCFGQAFIGRRVPLEKSANPKPNPPKECNTYLFQSVKQCQIKSFLAGLGGFGGLVWCHAAISQNNLCSAPTSKHKNLSLTMSSQIWCVYQFIIGYLWYWTYFGVVHYHPEQSDKAASITYT